MAQDPRSRRPGSPDQDEAEELLRALARSRGTGRPASPAPGEEAESLDSLHSLAERLDHQLRAPRRPASDARGTELENDHAQSADAARGQWAEFVAALPSARSLVPHLDLPRAIFVLIAVAVLGVAGAGRVIAPRTAMVPPVPPLQPGEVAPSGQGAPVASAPLAPMPPLDIPTITKAMAACDELAGGDTGSLNFLVLPLLQAAGDTRDWHQVALQTVGNSYYLLSSKDALDGLKNKSLVVRPDRYTFAILDPASGATYSWTSATGMSRLSQPNATGLKTIKLGFDFSERQNGPQWSAEFKREPGVCYTVAVLVLH